MRQIFSGDRRHNLTSKIERVTRSWIHKDFEIKLNDCLEMGGSNLRVDGGREDGRM
jgi:hypothetical protein